MTRSDKDATYESYKNRVENRVEGTCKWVLRHDNFESWLERDAGALLISADPSRGKSVLAKYLVDDFLPTKLTSTICYCFFKEQDQNTVRQALCALLHQLFCSNSALIRHAMDRFDKDGRALIESVLSLRSILNDVVQDPETGPIVIVLDALDECSGNEVREMLQNIERQCRKSQNAGRKLKYLLTSRPYEELMSKFRSYFDDSESIRIPGEDELETIGQEVNIVIKHRVDLLANEKGLSPAIKERLTEQLHRVSHRTYLWVYLIFNFLRDEHFKKTELGVTIATNTLPASVNAAYSKILSKSKNDTIVHKALAIILSAKRPLTLTEMNTAMNVESSTRNFTELDLEPEEDFIISLRNWCGLFVSVYEARVYFLHQTAREFLLAEVTISVAGVVDLRWQHSIRQHQANAVLAEVCMRFLNLPSDSLYCEDNEVQLAKSADGKHSLSEYAAWYWGGHFRQARFSSNDVNMVNLALRLIDPTSTKLSAWVSIYNQQESHNFPNRFNDCNTNLQLASYMGLTTATEFLLRKSSITMETASPRTGRTPLIWATYSCHFDIVELLLRNGANPNALGAQLGSALRIAAFYGKETVVELLLEKGADVNLAIPKYGCALRAATLLRREHGGIVKRLLDRGADIDRAVDGCGTALEAAAETGQTDLVNLLLKRGADVNKHGGTFGCALGAAIVYSYRGSKYHEIVSTLLDAGADIYAQCGYYGTALVLALMRHEEVIAKLLVSRGAGIHRKCGNYSNAITAAAKSGNEEVVVTLLQRGADIHVQGQAFANAVAAAASTCKTSVVQLLLAHGANIHHRGALNGSVMGEAAAHGQVHMVKLLLEYGASLSIANIYRRTPLHLTAQNVHSKVVKLLLEHGAYSAANGLDRAHETIASLFAFSGLIEALRYVIRHYNVDLHQTDTYGRTLLQWVARGGHDDTYKFLIAQGLHLSASDAKIDSLLNCAASGGSVGILDMMATQKPAPSVGYWSPLHWACRSGNVQMIDSLITRGFKEKSVSVPELEGEWTPLAIAVFHKISGKFLSKGCKEVLSFEIDRDLLESKYHTGARCDGCFHVSALY